VRTRFKWAQLWPKAHASAAPLHDQTSVVLNQLRELRATLAGHTARFDRVEERVDRIDEQLRDIHLLVARALAPGAANRLGLRNSADESPEGSSTCQGGFDGRPEDRSGNSPEDRLEDRVSDIERRLARVEERLDG
jgi:archaellum component FlaC